MLRGLWSQSEAADWRERLFAAAGTPPAVAAGGGGGASEIDGSLGSSKPGPPEGFRGRAQWGWRYEGPPDDPSLTDVANPHGLIFVQGTNLLGDEWFQLALEPRIVGAMTSVLGPDVNLHNMKASIKPPGHGTNARQGFHQDSYYIFEDPADGFCTLLLYLDSTAHDAGATMLAPGSHKDSGGLHGGLHSDDTADPAGGPGRIKEAAVEANGGWVTPEMNPGDAIILHAHVAHSVGRNLTNRTRAALAHVYKGAHVLDAEPGEGNTRSWAELPITRGGCAHSHDRLRQMRLAQLAYGALLIRSSVSGAQTTCAVLPPSRHADGRSRNPAATLTQRGR